MRSGARAQQAKELRIAIQPGILFFPMLVMQQAKIAEQLAARTGQADLKITWNSLLSGGANADALLAGNVDVSPAAPPTCSSSGRGRRAP